MRWYCFGCQHFFMPDEAGEGGVCPHCGGSELDKPGPLEMLFFEEVKEMMRQERGK